MTCASIPKSRPNTQKPVSGYDYSCSRLGADYSKIPGIEADNVYHAEEVFNDPALARGKVAILGEGFVGTELAIYLAGEYGIKADIIEMLGEVNGAGNSCHKIAVVDMLMQHDIPTHFNTKPLKSTPGALSARGPKGKYSLKPTQSSLRRG